MTPDSFLTKVPIDKGWSGDKKYRVTDAAGTPYLLRVSPMEQYARKKSEFAHMEQVAALGVPMCLPISFGTSDEGVYSVQSWITGRDAEEVIPALTAREQYAYGMDAGRILKRIHRIPAPPETEGWASFFNRKMDRKIKTYAECPIHYENGDVFVEYINAHRHLLADRPLSYQHGDYHIGNMMIDEAGRLCIIDFNRDDYGDPWEEFNRIVWCAQAAPRFATGMVNGYFESDVPMEFWQLLALYIATNALSSIPWAIPFGEREIAVMQAQAKDILRWYDLMQNPIPTWYMGADAPLQ